LDGYDYSDLHNVLNNVNAQGFVDTNNQPRAVYARSVQIRKPKGTTNITVARTPATSQTSQQYTNNSRQTRYRPDLYYSPLLYRDANHALPRYLVENNIKGMANYVRINSIYGNTKAPDRGWIMKKDGTMYNRFHPKRDSSDKRRKMSERTASRERDGVLLRLLKKLIH